MKNKKTSTAAVVYKIHIHTPHQHIAKLFVTNVPEEASKAELKEMIISYGYIFEEFGIPWANHYIQKDIKHAEAEVIGAYKRGNVETLEYDCLMENSTVK